MGPARGVGCAGSGLGRGGRAEESRFRVGTQPAERPAGVRQGRRTPTAPAAPFPAPVPYSAHRTAGPLARWRVRRDHIWYRLAAALHSVATSRTSRRCDALLYRMRCGSAPEGCVCLLEREGAKSRRNGRGPRCRTGDVASGGIGEVAFVGGPIGSARRNAACHGAPRQPSPISVRWPEPIRAPIPLRLRGFAPSRSKKDNHATLNPARVSELHEPAEP